MKKNLSERFMGSIAVYIVIIILAGFSLMPLAWMVDTSLKPLEQAFSSPPSWFSETMSLDNYYAILSGSRQVGSAKPLNFLTLYLNSLQYSISTVIVVAILSLPAAYALARINFPGKRYFLIFILFNQLLPQACKVIPLYDLFNQWGLMDQQIGLIFLYIAQTLPLCLWILEGVFEAIPREIDEAAKIDGASRLRILVSIFLPLSVHGLLAVAIYAFTGAWNEFFFANLFIFSADKQPLSAGLVRYITDVGTDWVKLMAAANLSTLPIIVLFILLNKLFVRGIMEGVGKA